MKQETRVWAVVPVKSFARAKARLAELLDQHQREQLARIMLEDVLTSLQRLEPLSGILVVSGDDGAKEIAGAHGATTVDDPLEDGPNAAIRLALPVLGMARADAMMVVPADVPQLNADELLPIVRTLSGASIALVRAARDGGTNLFGCSPVDLIQPWFGADSFARHIGAAERINIKPRVFVCASLAYDIDRPQDILEFRPRQMTRTEAYLARTLQASDNPGVAAHAQ
jgi:2-phospho-L-lactate/phosphoenolpyruvate guanylyltransferase